MNTNSTNKPTIHMPCSRFIQVVADLGGPVETQQGIIDASDGKTVIDGQEVFSVLEYVRFCSNYIDDAGPDACRDMGDLIGNYMNMADDCRLGTTIILNYLLEEVSVSNDQAYLAEIESCLRESLSCMKEFISHTSRAYHVANHSLIVNPSVDLGLQPPHNTFYTDENAVTCSASEIGFSIRALTEKGIFLFNDTGRVPSGILTTKIVDGEEYIFIQESLYQFEEHLLPACLPILLMTSTEAHDQLESRRKVFDQLVNLAMLTFGWLRTPKSQLIKNHIESGSATLSSAIVDFGDELIEAYWANFAVLAKINLATQGANLHKGSGLEDMSSGHPVC